MIEDVLDVIINFMTDTKPCTLCKETKTLDAFSIKGNGKPNSWCKECVSDRAKTYYRKKNPNAKDMTTYALRYGKRDDPDYDRKYKLINKYNLDEERVQQILESQDNKCPLCLTEFEGLEFSVDHDHACCAGQKSCGTCVRGFLCTPCNTGLGKLRDNVEVMRRAIIYLEANPFYDRRRS